MKTLPYRIFALALLIQSNYAFAGEPLKSPYFIDAVHCEGLEDKEIEAKLAEIFADDEVAKLNFKAKNQTNCERIFSRFGIEKFNWVTPDDLEKLRFGLTRSEKFKKTTLRIEKSELQNHVHVKVQFEQFEPRNYYDVNVSRGMDKGDATGSRNTSKAEAEFRFKQRGPENQPLFSVGIKSVNSSASAPLSSKELRKGNKNVVLTEKETTAQTKPNWQYDEVFYKVPLTNGIYQMPWEIKVGINSSRLTQDERSDMNPNIELSSLYQPDVFMPVKYRFSLLYSSYTASGSEKVINPRKDDDRSYKKNHLVFAGFRQDIKTKQISGHLAFNRSLTSDVHYFYDLDIKIRLGELAGLVANIGFADEVVYGAILPEHRFGLPNRRIFDTYVLAESNFRAFDSDNKLSLKVGSRRLSADIIASETGYYQRQSFAEVGVKTSMDTVDVGLSFIYGDKRLY